MSRGEVLIGRTVDMEGRAGMELQLTAATNPTDWLNDGLPGWIEGEPEWFDAVAKSMIHDDLVKDKRLLAKIRGVEVKEIISKRRNSIVGRKASVFQAVT